MDAYTFTPMPTPLIGRPHMPGYGISDDLEGALPWGWAEQRLMGARNYLLATARAQRAPHVTPVWGVWLDDAFWFSAGEASQKVRNLTALAHCTVIPEGEKEAVIVEGTAERLDDLNPAFVDAYKEKYEYKIDSGPLWVVTPRVAFGFVEDDDFAKTATRWSWEL